MNELLVASVLTKKEVCAIIGISRSTLRRYLISWGVYEEMKPKRIFLGKDLKLIHLLMEGTNNKPATS